MHIVKSHHYENQTQLKNLTAWLEALKLNEKKKKNWIFSTWDFQVSYQNIIKNLFSHFKIPISRIRIKREKKWSSITDKILVLMIMYISRNTCTRIYMLIPWTGKNTHILQCPYLFTPCIKFCQPCTLTLEAERK